MAAVAAKSLEVAAVEEVGGAPVAVEKNWRSSVAEMLAVLVDGSVESVESVDMDRVVF